MPFSPDPRLEAPGLRVRARAVSATAATDARVAPLPGGPVPYTLRRSPRSRGLRVTLDPQRGVLATVPLATRRGWARPEPMVERFLHDREPWLRRHLGRQAALRATLDARGPLGDGATVRYRGDLHRLIVEPGPAALRRSTVEILDGPGEPAILVRRAARDPRPLGAILVDAARREARVEVAAAVAAHAPALGVAPSGIAIRDARTRWGSASRKGLLSLSWRLVLAPPEALESVVIHELVHLRVFGHGPRFQALMAVHAPEHATWRRWLREHATELHATFREELELRPTGPAHFAERSIAAR
jgi:predicted metal-dependent hydrolase